jgi:hypothetical protein
MTGETLQLEQRPYLQSEEPFALCVRILLNAERGTKDAKKRGHRGYAQRARTASRLLVVFG